MSAAVDLHRELLGIHVVREVYDGYYKVKCSMEDLEVVFKMRYNEDKWSLYDISCTIRTPMRSYTSFENRVNQDLILHIVVSVWREAVRDLFMGG